MPKYDLYVVIPFRNEQLAANASIDPEPFRKRGWVGMDADYEEARKLLEELRKLQVNAYIVETRYKHPRVPLHEARAIAEKKYNKLVASGRNLEPLEAGYDDIMWWSFRMEDIDAVAKGYIPGVVVISVDKLDGHLRTPEEYKEWVKLSSFG